MNRRRFALTWESPAFCGPIGLKGGHGVLYHNNGDGTFTDVTNAAGLGAVKPSHAFTAVFDDFNQDGKIDLFVANDSDPNFLFLNQGDGTFKEVGTGARSCGQRRRENAIQYGRGGRRFR